MIYRYLITRDILYIPRKFRIIYSDIVLNFLYNYDLF